MTKYPNSECEAHRDVKTSQPVCIICMGNEIERLETDNAELSEALNVQNATIVDLGKENHRLKSAISWALGEGDSNFGENRPEGAGAFWWRKELRQRAESV